MYSCTTKNVFYKKENIQRSKRRKKRQKKEEKKKKTQICTTKVKPQLNPYCSKCPHKPPQSLTPKDERKYQKEKNYKKL